MLYDAVVNATIPTYGYIAIALGVYAVLVGAAILILAKLDRIPFSSPTSRLILVCAAASLALVEFIYLAANITWYVAEGSLIINEAITHATQQTFIESLYGSYEMPAGRSLPSTAELYHIIGGFTRSIVNSLLLTTVLLHKGIKKRLWKSF